VSKGASNENIPNGGSSSGSKIARIYVAFTFPSWQEDVVAMLKQGWDSVSILIIFLWNCRGNFY